MRVRYRMKNGRAVRRVVKSPIFGPPWADRPPPAPAPTPARPRPPAWTLTYQFWEGNPLRMTHHVLGCRAHTRGEARAKLRRALAEAVLGLTLDRLPPGLSAERAPDLERCTVIVG